jgi:hypothetical protein
MRRSITLESTRRERAVFYQLGETEHESRFSDLPGRSYRVMIRAEEL